MNKRALLSLLVIALVLVCLAGCGNTAAETTAPDPLAAYDGTWYMAKNGVECRFGEGKIYRDDQDSQEGQTLCGVYREVDDRVEANLAGVGGVDIARPLYIVETDAGEVLCDSSDGNGTVYFYRNAVTALALLEEAEAAAAAATPAQQTKENPDGILTIDDNTADGSDGSAGENRTLPTDEPSNAEAGTESTKVWIPKSGTKYHRVSDCSGMKNPSQVTKAEAERRGYTPCKRCY